MKYLRLNDSKFNKNLKPEEVNEILNFINLTSNNYLEKINEFTREKFEFPFVASFLAEDIINRMCRSKPKELQNLFKLIEKPQSEQTDSKITYSDFVKENLEVENCINPILFIYEDFLQNMELTTYLPIKALKKCNYNAIEVFSKKKDRIEFEKNVVDCFEFFININMPESIYMDKTLINVSQKEYQDLEKKSY